MQIIKYSEEHQTDWDAFVSQAPMGTFLHTRRFLAYHRARFDDVSVLLKNDKEQIVGVFPAAVDPEDSRRVVSHPGITYGGLLHSGELVGEKMLAAVEDLQHYFLDQGFEVLRYKPVPSIYHQRPSDDDLYALFRLGAARSRCDLSCAIDLANRATPSHRRKRGLKKALRLGVEVVSGEQHIDQLWDVIEDNLHRKLDEKPSHSRDEIKYLHSLFPENISFLVGRLAGDVVAGVTLFSTKPVVKAQYIASSQAGYDASALDAVFESAIELGRSAGRRYFDFGTSNRNEGQHLSVGVYQFKHEFGGTGVVHEFYDLNLRT